MRESDPLPRTPPERARLTARAAAENIGVRSGREPVHKIHFEDFKPGLFAEYGPRLVTREEILAFAAEFDPQPMHLDEDAARETLLGGLSASGWHTCGLMMRMMCDGFLLNSSSMGANAVEEVRWLKPVRPGDRLTLRVSVLETRASKTKPEMGFVTTLMEMINQDATRVMWLKSPLIFGTRQAGAAR